MTTVYRRARDTIPDDSRGIGSDGLVTMVGGGEDATAMIAQMPDGTELQTPDAPGLLLTENMTPVYLDRHLDTLAAAQVAMLRLLRGLEIYSFDLERLIENGSVASRQLRLQRVFFDHPRMEDELDPMPSAAIVQSGPERYDYQSLDTQLLEDTVNVFAPGTVLRKAGHANLELDVVIWSAHKEERRGIKAALQRALLAELRDDRPGRSVIVPEYYDRVVRFSLENISYPDTADSAQANQWILEARVSADVDVVYLVTRPPWLEVVVPVDAGPDVVP